MMPPPSPWALSLGAAVLLALALSSWLMRLQLGGQLLRSGLRMTAQLGLAALILRWLFAQSSLSTVLLSGLLMLALAAREVQRRQGRPLPGRAGGPIAAASLFSGCFLMLGLSLGALGAEPWYSPRLAIPLLGMLLGNTMTATALAADRLTEQLYLQREAIEARLALGHSAAQVSLHARREAVRTGVLPLINSMAAVGVISLPGMMTGQILGGVAPADAVRAQLYIMFMIAGSTGVAVLLIVQLSCRRLFDSRDRLRLDRLAGDKST